MADAKSNGCVAPFSDEEIKVLRMEFDGRDRTVGFQLTAERYDRFLATIAADRKRIEELEHTRLGRVCPTCAKQTVDPMKWCDRLAAEQVADQAATIERLRGYLQRIADQPKQYDDHRGCFGCKTSRSLACQALDGKE